MNSKKLLSIGDYERAAKAVLPHAVFGYVNGGTEDCLTLQAKIRFAGYLHKK